MFWRFLIATFIGLLLLVPVQLSREKTDQDDEEYKENSELKEDAKTPVTEDYNEEEFVGFENLKTQKATKQLEQLVKKSSTEANTGLPPPPPPPSNYYLEMFYVTMLFIYGINYFVGKRKNEEITTAWAAAVGKILSNNFTKVGEANRVSIIKESQYSFRLSATGRVHCVGMQATLELRKRHDLFSLLMELIWKNEDLLTIDVAMEEDSMDNFVFAVVKKKDDKKFKKQAKEIPLFTTATSADLPGMIVYSEAEELVPSLLNHEVITTLKNYENYFVRMYFTDQTPPPSKYKKTLQFVFRLPSPSNMQQIQTLTKMVMHFIDEMSTISLSKQARQKSEKNRAKAAEAILKQTHAERQEAAQQRKLDKKQKELQQLEQLSPEEREKREERQHKKDLKKKQPKFKVMLG